MNGNQGYVVIDDMDPQRGLLRQAVRKAAVAAGYREYEIGALEEQAIRQFLPGRPLVAEEFNQLLKEAERDRPLGENREQRRKRQRMERRSRKK